MGNPFVHVELLTDDILKAKTFYSGLFDWTLEEMPEMDYTMIQVGDGTGGGMMKNAGPGVPSHWFPYVLVADVEASTEKAKSLGARVCKEVTELPGFGWFSVIQDPTDAALGLWQPKEPCK